MERVRWTRVRHSGRIRSSGGNFLINARNKLPVLLGWAYAYLVNTPEARIIVYPPAVPAPDKRG